jgi:glycosyltransferase involved in cell wall biosynthesis
MGGRPVLFVSYSGALGGAERVLLDCATRLGRPAVLACPDGPLAQASPVPVEPIRPRTPHLRGERGAATGALAGFAYEVVRLVRRVRPAAVAAWSARAVLASVLLPPGTKVVAVHHDFAPSRPLAIALRAAGRRAARVVATSQAVAEELRGDVVLAPGVDLEAWTPAPMPMGLPPRALVLGALVPWKRADLALEIAARVPGLQLTVAGPGDVPAALRARASLPDLDGRVAFPGPLANPREALAGSHVLLHCADREPWGLVLLEALASGRNVVAPAAGGPLEIVAPGAGRLYAPGDPDAGAAALRAQLAAPDPGAARARAEAFPVEASAARLAEALA